ncbi:tRNA (adenosine(37)-N6)-dimethylallyltransferase MiaA [Altererythrobacter aurantiacus]|uniref:tRNA dimethylallyltransferase n=1 Tax=Parapontixanthobacter aurantiacus TaxID=1463599 RepID=A0A844ZBL8_9SPHN|nr:tRNA (adenosine(37)-N6)-dimethylallyltransferase MiaA [Parapontixanthobacter aurantiacus]MXO85188.1 tRNA (adenosine(37)-N6)-dimethylallyltransferase MiaA [Parapontixanthobacter aurantiacus]
MGTDNSSFSFSDKPLLGLIAGPTASGKTDLALALADHLSERGCRTAIVNADSAQVYRDLCVLSARPTGAEMARVPHFLFGEWDGAQPCSAADWAAKAKEVIARLHEESVLPILVGGTGLYMRVLLDGIAPVPAIDPQVRQTVRSLSQEDAYRALLAEDPEAAARLAPADNARTTRALEVVRSTGRPIGEWRSEKEGGIASSVDLRPAILLPEREWLYERCDRRFRQMLDRGAIEEVERLLARGLDPNLPVMRAIGVPEIAHLLADRISREEMIERGQRATRNYAKRQFTWFRRQPPEEWPRIEYDNLNVAKEIIFPLYPC